MRFALLLLTEAVHKRQVLGSRIHFFILFCIRAAILMAKKQLNIHLPTSHIVIRLYIHDLPCTIYNYLHSAHQLLRFLYMNISTQKYKPPCLS